MTCESQRGCGLLVHTRESCGATELGTSFEPFGTSTNRVGRLQVPPSRSNRSTPRDGTKFSADELKGGTSCAVTIERYLRADDRCTGCNGVLGAWCMCSSSLKRCFQVRHRERTCPGAGKKNCCTCRQETCQNEISCMAYGNSATYSTGKLLLLQTLNLFTWPKLVAHHFEHGSHIGTDAFIINTSQGTCADAEHVITRSLH